MSNPSVAMMTDEEFNAAVQAAIGELSAPKRTYDRAEELTAAGKFVARFGPLGNMYEGPGLRLLQDSGPVNSAWHFIGHWSAERNDGGTIPETFSDIHLDDCDVCDYLECVLGIVEIFNDELCPSCGRDIDAHDITPAQSGEPVSVCHPMTDLDEALLACRLAKNDGTTIDGDTARLIANMYHRGETSASLTFATSGKLLAFTDDLWAEMFDRDDLDANDQLLAEQMRAYLDGIEPIWTRCEPVVSPAGEASRHQVGEAYNTRWATKLTDGTYGLITRTYFLFRRPIDGVYEVLRHDEYLVCSNLADPGGTEIVSEVLPADIDSQYPQGEDLQALARDAEPPQPGEWERDAPTWGRGLLPAVA